MPADIPLAAATYD